VTLPLLLIALVMLGSAAVALTRRNLIHGALCFILSWAGVAAFYLWAGAQFLAFAQVLVYIGAVSMVVLFAMLLTRQGDPEPVRPESIIRALGGLLAASGVAGVMIGAILGTPLDVAPSRPAGVTVRQLGEALMGPHAASLIIVGLILTVALLGAVLIASTDRSNLPEDYS
jgi:NADH:ubiquinone oxidoreductase subunit 6 (subunit J)